MNSSKKMEPRNKKIISIAVLILALAAILLVSAKFLPSGVKTERVGDTVYKRVNLQKADSKLPEGLPERLPVETAMAQESYSSHRDGREAALISYAYLSTKTPKQVYDEYHSYMVSNQYGITSQSVGSEVDDVLTIEGTKDGNDLSVVITNVGGAARVQISYLKRS